MSEIKETLLLNSNPKASNHEFVNKIKKRILVLNEDNIVISYRIIENKHKKYIGCVIKFRSK